MWNYHLRHKCFAKIIQKGFIATDFKSFFLSCLVFPGQTLTLKSYRCFSLPLPLQKGVSTLPLGWIEETGSSKIVPTPHPTPPNSGRLVGVKKCDLQQMTKKLGAFVKVTRTKLIWSQVNMWLSCGVKMFLSEMDYLQNKSESICANLVAVATPDSWICCPVLCFLCTTSLFQSFQPAKCVPVW